MDKPTIFFSHSSKDRDLILPIKNKLIDITSGTMNIFMSSDGQSIPFGRNWISKIEEGLGNAKIMFVFVTPNSINSDWIYFEAGYAYSKGIEVIPVGIGVHIGELNPPLNLLQGFDVLSYDSMNNFISIINKRFSLSFKKEFNQSDYSLVCQVIFKKRLNIDISKTVGLCKCGYCFNCDEKDASDFYEKLTQYFQNRKIKYSFSTNVLLVKGIKISTKSYSRNQDNTWSSSINFQLASINLKNNFELLIDTMKFLEVQYLHLYLELDNMYYCVCRDEEISAIISTTDDLNLHPNKIGVFKYKDIEWKVSNNYKREFVMKISFAINKADFDVIISLLNYLYQIGILCLIDEKK